MTRKEFDESYSLYQLSELIEQLPSKREVKKLLQTFTCSKNSDLESFLHNKSITFEKHLRSRTYIYVNNETKKVSAYFTIAVSTLHTDGITPETIKILDGYQNDTTSIPCFLIGQLGKSDNCNFTGEFLLEDTIDTIDALHHAIGGRFILLDSINAEKVIEFYKRSLFFPIEEPEEEQESIKMIRPYFEELE